MRVLLDTSTFIRAMESPGKLSKRAATVLHSPANTLELSAISLTEIAIKPALEITGEQIRQALEDLDIRILPYTREHAFELLQLPFHHRDPFDRQIIAQALVEAIPVITPADAFRSYQGIKVIW